MPTTDSPGTARGIPGHPVLHRLSGTRRNVGGGRRTRFLSPLWDADDDGPPPLGTDRISIAVPLLWTPWLSLRRDRFSDSFLYESPCRWLKTPTSPPRRVIRCKR